MKECMYDNFSTTAVFHSSLSSYTFASLFGFGDLWILT